MKSCIDCRHGPIPTIELRGRTPKGNTNCYYCGFFSNWKPKVRTGEEIPLERKALIYEKEER